MPEQKDPNTEIMDKLREQFEKLTAELKPEMEPAVVYELDAK
jgi:hypothetical protein